MPELDILYMTRVQRERFFNEDDYVRLKDSYILTPDKLKTAKQDLWRSSIPCRVSMRSPWPSTKTRAPATSSRSSAANISVWH